MAFLSTSAASGEKAGNRPELSGSLTLRSGRRRHGTGSVWTLFRCAGRRLSRDMAQRLRCSANLSGDFAMNHAVAQIHCIQRQEMTVTLGPESA